MADAQIRVVARDEASGILKNISQGILQGFGQAAFGLIQNAVSGATGAFINFVQTGITKASDLNETINKTNVVFGDAAASMLKWSESAATNIGLSQQSALDAAAGFAVFGKAAGLAGDDITKFAQDGLARAADIASIFNAKVEDVAVAIQAAFRGETEPIRKYGVMLDDATLRQKALALGIISTTKDALTPQQKTLAANALIMEQTAFTAGDFKNTSDGLANSQRILGAQIENAQAKLGTMFLPIVTKVMGFVNTQAIPILQDLISEFQTFAGPILESVSGALDTIGTSISGFDFGNFIADVKEIGANITGKLRPGLDSFARFFTQQGPTIRAISETMLTKFSEVARWFSAQILPFLVEQFTKLGNWFANNGPLITRFGAVMAAVFGGILVTLQTFWVIVKPILGGLITILMDVARFVMQVFTGDFSGAFETIKQIVSTAIDAVLQSLSNLTTWVTGWFDTDWATVSAQWQSFFDGLAAAVSTWWDNVKTGFDTFFTKIKTAITNWASNAKKSWQTGWENLKQTLNTISSQIKQSVLGWLSGIVNDIVNFARDLYQAWENAWNSLITAIDNLASRVATSISNLITGIITAINEKITEFLAIGAAIVNAIQQGIVDAWEDFVAWITEQITGLLGNILNALGINLPEGQSAMRSYGYNLMSSLAEGIMQGAQLPQMAIASVSMGMTGGVSSGGGVYASSGSHATTTNQRNYIYGPVTLQMTSGRGTELLKIR